MPDLFRHPPRGSHYTAEWTPEQVRGDDMIIGHDEAVEAFLDAARSGRMHHAWLLAGPQGVGKASFALAAARWLLADAAGPAVPKDRLDVPDDHRIVSLLEAGSHPDFKLL